MSKSPIAAIFFSLVLTINIVLCGGCSLLAKTSESSRIRQQDPNAILGLKSLKLKNLQTMLAKRELTQRIRLVEIFASGTTERPEYRLFGILPGSVYEELGLEDGDVLLSCENRYLVTGDLFLQYINLLPQLKQTSLEFRRGSKIYAMRYAIQ